MIAQTRFLGRNKGLAAQKKKQAARRKSKGSSPTLGEFPYAQNDYSVIFGGERKKLDPYAIPKKEEQPKERIILSQDPIIRVMIENNSDIKYEEAMKEEEEQSKADSSTLSPSSTHTVQGVFTKAGGPRTSSSTFSPTASSLGRRGSSSTLAQRFQHFVSVAREKSRNRLFKGDRAHPRDSAASRTNGTGTSRGGGIVRFSKQESEGHQVPKVVIDGLSPTLHQRRTLFQTKARNLNCCASFGSQGRVTSGCLWHAFRAITLGVLLIGIGITMAILGFLDDQRNLQQKTFNKSLSVSNVIVSPGPPATTLTSLPNSGVPNATTGTASAGPSSKKRPGERSKLNDQRPLAFSPGLTRQDRFKLNNLSFAGPVVMGVGGFLIVAACVMTFEARDNAAKVVPSTNSAQNEEKAKTRALKFRSSSSQTTFLDRNIVETLHVDPSSGSSVSPRGGNCKVLSAVGASAQVGVGSAAAATAGLFDLQNTFRPLAVPSNLNISGSTYSTKRASFNGKLPAASDFEPGLALMDEIGRRALTNAFIQFTRNTSNPSAYRDSLIYNIQPSHNYPKEDDGEFRGSGHLEVGQAIPKCPSAPDIAHHKLDHNVTMSGHVASHRRKECVDGQIQGDPSSQQPEYEPLPTLRGQYRVLTPTMYRSRMAATRQAISMDCEGSNTAKTRREGPSLRIPSPFQNPIRKFAQDSLDLELGASATGVHNLANRGAAVANSSSTEGHTAKSSNQSQRESREIYEEHSNSSMLLDLHLEGSAPVTLLVRDESRSTRSTSGNRELGSNNRSPPSLHEQMSCERLKLSCSHSNSNPSSASSSSSLPKQEETSIFGGSGSVEQEEDEEAEREAAHFDDHNEKRIRDRRKSFRQSKMRQKKHARQTRQRRNSDPSFDSSFDAGKDDANHLPDRVQRHHPQIESPSTLSDDDDEELLVVDSLHQATVTLKSQSSQLNVKFDVAKGPEIPTATVLQQNLESTEGVGLEGDNSSINNRMQTILEEDAAVTISLVGALGAVGKKHFQGQKASKSCDDPVVTPPTPFGSYKRQERWSKSLAEEMATLSFIDTSPIEERESRPSQTVPLNIRGYSTDHYHYYYHHHRSPPSTRHDGPEPNVSQSFASLASEEETSSPDEGGTLKRNNKVQTGFRSDYRSGESAVPTRAQSTSAYSKSEPLLYAAKIYDPEEEEHFLDIAEDSISLSPEAFPVTYSAELPPPPKQFDDHMLRGTIDSRSQDRTQSNLEPCQPMSAPLVRSCPRSHQEKERSGIEAHSSTIDTQTSTRACHIESKDKYSIQF